jgi:hypothetical protein
MLIARDEAHRQELQLELTRLDNDKRIALENLKEQERRERE